MSPPVTVTAPRTSIGPRSTAGGEGTYLRIAAPRPSPTGTLIRKTQLQPGPDVSAPPAMTPIEAALPPTAPKMPRALLRAAPWANVLVTIERADGEARAAAGPCSARNVTS